jgi:hypothetical protein
MRSFNVNPDHLMSEVYSYPFPEVRQTISGLDLDPRFMLNTLKAEEAAGMLATYGFSPALALPEHTDGSLNLDEIHTPVIERITNTVGETLQGLHGYEHAYPTHGSSQAMFTLMAEWSARKKLDAVAVLRGEYEGYAAYAQNLDIPLHVYEDLDQVPKQGEVWFISNPSARDGNWLSQEEWNDFTNKGHSIVYDAAYVGLTDNYKIDVDSPNFKAVLTSPSKIFGVFRYRNTGVTYTREPVASMYGSKWFKDVPALLDTLKLYEEFGRGVLPAKYKPVQKLICKALAETIDAEINTSDVLLLSNTQNQLEQKYERFHRGDGYRFGLTKLFEDYEAR